MAVSYSYHPCDCRLTLDRVLFSSVTNATGIMAAWRLGDEMGGYTKEAQHREWLNDEPRCDSIMIENEDIIMYKEFFT